nr:hypothetical protein CFP56_31722 [Quercus suber]
MVGLRKVAVLVVAGEKLGARRAMGLEVAMFISCSIYRRKADVGRELLHLQEILSPLRPPDEYFLMLIRMISFRAGSMPKKHQVTFKNYGPSTSQHNSSSSAHHGSSNTVADSALQTVNQRLNALRILPVAEATIKKQQLADQANQRSVPPHLRGILGVSDSAPLRPKIGIRFRDRMRTPGPPPPRSWLVSEPAWRPNAAMGRKKKGKRVQEIERSRPETIFRFEKLVADDVGGGAESGRLLQMTLKRVAQSWEMLDEDDYPALLDLPLRLRLRLLPYLGFYGPTIDIAAFQALTQGGETISSLDLGGLAGHGLLTLKRIAKLIETDRQRSIRSEDNIADSWDAVPTAIEAITLSPSMPRFSNLTRICLSHPPPTVLWQDLLNLSKQIPKVTHLSLAFWPRPTLTPNLTTATVSSQHGPDINAGGSNLYSTIESDREEPAALLKQLSSHTLCLQWLDLEGCADWSPALSLPSEQVIRSPQPPADHDAFWSQNPTSATTIFCDTWKNLTYLNLAQAGPFPTLLGLEAQPPTLSHHLLLSQLRTHLLLRENKQHLSSPPSLPPTTSRDIYDTEKRFAAMWLAREAQLQRSASHISTLRAQRKMARVVTEFGWRRAIGTAL